MPSSFPVANPPPVSRDRVLLCLAALLRATATGLCGVVLALALAARGCDAAAIGLLVSLGLAGGFLATLGVSLGAGRLGRVEMYL